METLTVYPQTQEQLDALKAIIIAMNIPFFEEEEAPTPEYVIEAVKKSIKEADEGKLRPFTSVQDMLNQAEQDRQDDIEMQMVKRKEDFQLGKTTSRPWSEIKKRYEKWIIPRYENHQNISPYLFYRHWCAGKSCR